MTITANIAQSNEQFQVIEILSTEASYDTSAIISAIAAVDALAIDFKKGVIISHRGAIWLHSAIAHHCHIAVWVAHLDPRLGAVVVQSHFPGVRVGDIIEIPKTEVVA
jgi:CRISPR-associated Csx3 family protein